MKYQTRISLIVATLFVSGCAIWPDYQKPIIQVPASYKEANNFPGWKVAEPQDHQAGGTWWSVYEDAQLSTLIDDASKANQTIAQAEANYRQAEALSRVARAALFPSLTGNASAKRGQTGEASAQSTYAIGVNAAWEADLWGKIQRGIESGDATLAASAADLNNAILLVQSTLAQNYFQLRILDSQKKLLDDTAIAYERSLTLTNNRYKVGLASRTEIAQAEAQLRTTRAQAIDISGQRAQLEHAIAVLTGRTPAEFSLASAPLPNTATFKLPDTPASLPSTLLERRPDIAAAERRAAAANAQIGIAKAALFPSLNLAGNFGFQSNRFADLFTLPSRIWSLGPLLAVSISDGG
ncbi:MAG: efflux transporter outer membrane subunit, partial [Pseudomonadota bacterium]